MTVRPRLYIPKTLKIAFWLPNWYKIIPAYIRQEQPEHHLVVHYWLWSVVQISWRTVR